MKHLVTLAVILVLSAFAPPSLAASYSTDQSDLWYIPSESGWGIQLVQRNSTIFATMFVYDQSGNPTWYVATLTPENTAFVWSGALYATHGSFFGQQPYNPAQLSGGPVGTMTWSATSVISGTLTYNVNGIAVSKTVTREYIATDDYSGKYAGGIHELRSGCSSSANNGTYEEADLVTVSQRDNSVTFTSVPLTGGSSCTYVGTLTQLGQMGTIDGTYTCANGFAGTFEAFEVQVNVTGLTGRFNSSVPSLGCSGSGWFGGVRTSLQF